MERARVVVEDQRQEVAVAFPEREFRDPVDVDPFQRAFRIVGVRRAAPASDEEHEAEPVLAGLAEAGPADGAAQPEFVAVSAASIFDCGSDGSRDAGS